MLRDRGRLRQRLGEARRRLLAGEELARQLADLSGAVAASRERAVERRGRVPPIHYPPELPITAAVDRIAEAIAGHPVTVVCGETGSGKTTQLPKVCLALGRGVHGVIGHTQPRRIAARSVAARIARELGPTGPLLVGDKVRFNDRTRPETAVKLMTDGILLAEVQADRQLLAYDTLIVDEAHERSLNIDFLLGYLKRLLARRSDLKLIVTSATIDPERFSRHFGGAPVVEVPGRTYPVELRYRPLPAADPDARDQGLGPAVLAAVDELAREGPGDVLVFLPGEREIRETAEALRKHHPAASEVLPLYARLSAAEQERVFQSGGRRRIVLATNVAETSLTVPGIRYVVDTGLARLSRYSHRTKIQRLPIEKISQASADQRKGRCGRLGPGVCVRLYEEEDYALRARFTDPEILRTSLAAVILRMEALGLGAVERFPFVDPPDPRYVNDGYRLLAELGAVDGARRLTPLGRELARLPVDPRLGRMLLAAREEGALAEVLVIVSALAVQDPRERPAAARDAADAAHRAFQDPRSDFLALLRIWGFYREQARHLSQAKLRQLCREHFLSYLRMREWHDTHQQLLGLLHDMGVRPNEAPAEYGAVHRAVLAGLLGQIGLKREDGAYRGPRGTVFHLFPASGLAGRGPRWVMAAELVETRRVYARTVAAVEPEWVEPLAGHLVRRHHDAPRFDPRRGEVTALEDVTLYGLPVVTRRTVPYAPVDPGAAREVFIREALVAGRHRPEPPFLRHNRRLRREVEGLEHKARRQDILVDDEVLYRFYAERIPEGLASVRALDAWRREAERRDPRVLFLAREDLMRHAGAGLGPERFPDVLEVEGARLALAYRFEPGHEADGVTARVPVALLGRLAPARFEWIVPGLLEEKVTALVRALPRAIRRHFIPAAEFARAAVEALGPPRGAFREALSRELGRMTGVEVPAGAWDPADLAPHLRMRFEVVDTDGRVLAAGRDFPSLQQALQGAVAERLEAAPWPGLVREPARHWAFGDLPERVAARLAGVPVEGYPALADEGEAVRVRVLLTPEEAAFVHRRGLLRLFLLDLRPQLTALRRGLPGLDRACLLYARLPPSPRAGPEAGEEAPCAELGRHLVEATVTRCLLEPAAAVRTEAAYRARREAGRPHLVETAGRVLAAVAEALDLRRTVIARLEPTSAGVPAEAAADVRRQLDQLLYRGFVRATPDPWLGHLPRYLRAMTLRLERAGRQPARDLADQRTVERLWQRWEALARERPGRLAPAVPAESPPAPREARGRLGPGPVEDAPPLPREARDWRGRGAPEESLPLPREARDWRGRGAPEKSLPLPREGERAGVRGSSGPRAAELAPASPQAAEGPTDRSADLEELRWLLEELRVSLFAQGLRTAVPVSAQRIERRLDALARGLQPPLP
jgi:ATP-dependent helicase HrpA